MRWLLFFRNVGILTLLGINGLVKGQGDRIIFPNDPSLMNMLNVTDKEVLNKSFLSFDDSNDDVCFTPDGDLGECVDLEDCPELISFIGIYGLRNFGSVNFLRNRICRYLFRNVQLCCVQPSLPFKSNPTNPVPVAPPTPPSIIPAMEDCGLGTTTRITLGTGVPHGSHPWLVGVGIPQGRNGFRVFCGGTLITRRHVLSAGHCFVQRRGFPRLSHVRLGDHSLSQNNERLPPITLAIGGRRSPGYNSRSQLNDIELLIMATDVQFTQFIRPACLPFDFKSKNFDNEPMTIIGWGDTSFRSNNGNDVPLLANITVVPKNRCKEAYKQSPQVPLDDTQLCVGGNGKDACQGDSGGPLLYLDLEKHFRYFLIGIVSFGIECGNPNFPGVYTFIPEFLDWITENL